MLTPSRDYTDRDFDSIRARLISNLTSLFPTWTDTQVNDFGTLLIDAFSFVGDVAMFNLDAAALEAKWGTATQIRSLLRLAKMIAYVPKGASAASVMGTLSATGLVANVTAPAGTLTRTKGSNPVTFQTLTATILSPSTPSVDVAMENSLTHSESFSPTLAVFQTKVLGQTPYLRDSLIVTSAQGTWTEVSNFLASRSSDLHYTVTIDANDQATITFGDGSVGALPIGTTTFVYKTGGGIEGMVGPGVLTDIQGTFHDTLGTQITITATNVLAPVGGEEKETVATIKVSAPQTIRAGDRTVSREDFETRGRAAAGVGRCLMLTHKEDPSVDPNTGMLWVVPTGQGFLTPPLRANIAAQYTKYPYAPSFVLDVMDPEYLDVAVFARIYLQGTAKASTVKAAVLANLTAWFALTTTDLQGNVIDNPTSNFGYYLQDSGGVPIGSIAYSDIFNVVRDTAGVRKVGGNPEDFLLSSASELSSGATMIQYNAHADLVITSRQYPRLSGFSSGLLSVPVLTLVNGDTGDTL